MKDLSIIIVNFNTKELLRNCLYSILKSSRGLNFEIIVVDNHSTDSSQAMIKENFPQVKLIKNKENVGFGRANNQGAKEATGRYLFFLNSDTIILNDCLKRLVKFMDKHQNIGVSGPRILLKDGHPQPAAFGPEPTFWQLTFGRFLKTDKIDWLSGAALIVRRKIFETIGGFDENFFMYFEDVDLCKRVKALGYQVSICPFAKVIHLLGQSIKRNKERKILYFKSQDYFYKKHYGLLVWVLLVLVRFPYKLWQTLR